MFWPEVGTRYIQAGEMGLGLKCMVLNQQVRTFPISLLFCLPEPGSM